MNSNPKNPPSFEDFLRTLGLEIELPPVEEEPTHLATKEEIEQQHQNNVQTNQPTKSGGVTNARNISEVAYASDLAWEEKNAQWNNQENAWERKEINWEAHKEHKEEKTRSVEKSPSARMREVRRGIVWSEILQPPLAKRRK